MSDPEHIAGRSLLADTLEQLGYQSESAPWRNFYLCGALELRNGLKAGSKFNATDSMAKAMPLDNLFQTLAVRLNSKQADGLILHINLKFTDQAPMQLSIENSVLNAFPNKQHPEPAATIEIATLAFKRLMLRLTTAPELLEAGAMTIDGDVMAFAQLGGLFDQFDRRFPLVTPRPPWEE